VEVVVVVVVVVEVEAQSRNPCSQHNGSRLFRVP
jgi:hypothetical protein